MSAAEFFPERPLVAAAVTPLAAGGDAVDLEAIAPYVAFLEANGVDGVFACGTTGEGVLLRTDERMRVAAAFRAVTSGRLIMHVGAQTTADTVELAAHSREIGADAVAVIPPPYFVLDDDALTAHMVAAAAAADPLPFFCYAFAPRSGYPLPIDVVRRVARQAGNFAGLKVSESPFARVEPYLELGVPVLVGSEPVIPEAIAHGAKGTVSGMAAAFPDVVRAALDAADAEARETLLALRAGLEGAGQFIAAVKHVLGARGVAVRPDVRLPLRALTAAEIDELDGTLAAFLLV